ncbi:MAG TPA: hypothetical protein VK174_18480 [Chitinophagales bacterium]|nr:hypothetical protein [Chitinophagales bacterium]
MNTAHWHLILNHVPILGTLACIIIIAFGLLRKNRDTQLLGLAGVVVMALISLIVMETGEGAEELVEKLPGIADAAMDAHEDAAKIANIILIVAGVFSVISLALHFFKSGLYVAAVWLTLIISAVAFGFMGYTGYLGGKIRHTETSAVNAANPQQTGDATETATEEED